MSIWESVFYGILQGIAEFLPISSSGHLAIFQSVFGAGDPDANISFNILLHLGTLIAVFAVYWRDILQLILSFFTLCGKLFRGNFKLSTYTEHERMIIFILIATLPLFPAVLVEDYVAALSSYYYYCGRDPAFQRCPPLLLGSDGQGQQDPE